MPGDLRVDGGDALSRRGCVHLPERGGSLPALGDGGDAMTEYTINFAEIDWIPCEEGPFFLQGYPCCAGHARERAESGDLGVWTDTTNWPPE
jgi:hypothetical protein